MLIKKKFYKNKKTRKLFASMVGHSEGLCSYIHVFLHRLCLENSLKGRCTVHCTVQCTDIATIWIVVDSDPYLVGSNTCLVDPEYYERSYIANKDFYKFSFLKVLLLFWSCTKIACTVYREPFLCLEISTPWPRWQRIQATRPSTSLSVMRSSISVNRISWACSETRRLMCRLTWWRRLSGRSWWGSSQSSPAYSSLSGTTHAKTQTCKMTKLYCSAGQVVLG